jgi:hypothetical protein
MPPNTVKVDRSTKWGNPFTIKSARAAGFRGSDADLAHMCVAEFRQFLGAFRLDELRASLRGKNLACWCPLDQPCHADVLLEIANRAEGRSRVEPACPREGNMETAAMS